MSPGDTIPHSIGKQGSPQAEKEWVLQLSSGDPESISYTPERSRPQNWGQQVLPVQVLPVLLTHGLSSQPLCQNSGASIQITPSPFSMGWMQHLSNYETLICICLEIGAPLAGTSCLPRPVVPYEGCGARNIGTFWGTLRFKDPSACLCT